MIIKRKAKTICVQKIYKGITNTKIRRQGGNLKKTVAGMA